MPKKPEFPTSVDVVSGESFSVPQGTLTISKTPTISGKSVILTDDEVKILQTLLDRDRTSKLVHGGLKGLLGFSDREAETLLNFLRRI